MVKAKIEGSELVLRVPLQTPTPSSTGLTLLIANTKGFKPTDMEYEGKPVSVNITACFKAKAG